MSETITLTSADGFTFPAYVAEPPGKPKGAIVVLQEIFGVNAHIRAVTDGYAAQGYWAIAPATFHRVKPGVELGYSGDDMGAGSALKAAVESLPSPNGNPVTPLVMQDIQAAINAASAHGKVGIVGYCWGGLLTWRSACLLTGLSAAVPYYGGGMTAGVEASRKPVIPVLAHFGEKDHWISLDSVNAFKAAQPGVEVHIYAADHGFNCDHRGSFDAPAAQLALARTLAFFAKYVG
jgi:carboxymethylenebutenolidase